MDGFKRRLRDSIQFRLSFWLSSAILVIAVIAGIFSFASAFDEAYELQDDMLRQVAALFDRPGMAALIPDEGGRQVDASIESRVTIQRLAESPAAQGGSGERTALPFSLALVDGLQTLYVHDEPFRVFVKTLATGERFAVAQETEVRDEIARHGAFRTILPFLVLIPVLLLFVASLVRKVVQPVSSLALEIDQRGDEALHPVPPDHLPSEIRPFITAINRLLERVARSMEAKRRFVADAAHELRSPLTALSLQAERLAGAEMSVAARERLEVLRQGIERGRNLLEQLLTLARAQAEMQECRGTISVQAIYRQVLEDLMPLAAAKQIDIGVESEMDVQLPIHEMDLKTIVKNLVDNAIRYTPSGGRIDLFLFVDAGQAVLQIDDAGPGIPPAERERVFEPFYRVLGSNEIGSGLGLSIVKTIAERVGAKIELGDADETHRRGLRVRLLFPPIAPATGTGQEKTDASH